MVLGLLWYFRDRAITKGIGNIKRNDLTANIENVPIVLPVDRRISSSLSTLIENILDKNEKDLGYINMQHNKKTIAIEKKVILVLLVSLMLCK